jgi:hypothetical protein
VAWDIGTTETHRITAGNNFTGELPSTKLWVDETGIRQVYKPSAQGGLFVLKDPAQFATVAGIILQFGADSPTWSLHLSPPVLAEPFTQGPDALLKSGLASSGEYIHIPGLTVPRGWRLKLVTAGAALALAATVIWGGAGMTESEAKRE